MQEYFNNYNEVIEILLDAIDKWNSNDDRTVFVLKTLWFDEEILEEKSSECGVFRNSSQIIEYINKEKETEYDHELKEEWYEAELWTLNKSEKYEIVYAYTLIDKTVCFINDSRLCCSTDLNLPIPYEVGDIVKIDCWPFAPVKPAIIVEKYDNYDCCGVQVLCRNEDGNYRTTPLKHSHMYAKDYRSLLSPLYRLDYYSEEYEHMEELIRKATVMFYNINNNEG